MLSTLWHNVLHYESGFTAENKALANNVEMYNVAIDI